MQRPDDPLGGPRRKTRARADAMAAATPDLESEQDVSPAGTKRYERNEEIPMADPDGSAPPRRPWYKNTPLIAGLVLLALGLGNWITGSKRTAEHAHRIEEALQAQITGGSGGERPSAEEVEIARVRMDFYHVVASGGRLMTAAGFLLTTFGLARSLRPQARRG